MNCGKHKNSPFGNVFPIHEPVRAHGKLSVIPMGELRDDLAQLWEIA